MRPLRHLVLVLPVAAGLVVPLAIPAEAHGRHDNGAAIVAGLIGLGLGAVAGNALTAGSGGYGPTYYQPHYAPPPAYGYAPAYGYPPAYGYAPAYAPPPVVYASPPPVAYAAPPRFYAPQGYAPPTYLGQPGYGYARWGDDDDD